MKTKLVADFHIHTQASDGIGTVQDVLQAAAAQGMSAVAITDHDVLDAAQWCYGYMRHLRRCADKSAVMAIPGIEISSWMERDGSLDIIHMLGLGIDPYDSTLLELSATLQEVRREVLEERLLHVRQLGYALDAAAEGRVRSSAYWGKSEIAREEVVARRFDTVHDAYHALWDSLDPTPNMAQYLPCSVAIEAIHGAGGIAVMAHPLRDEVTNRHICVQDGIRRIDLLRDEGLDGVECYYSAFRLDDCEALEAATRDRQLIVSAGSDHHDFYRRRRLGITCSDGANYAYRSNVLEALKLS